MTVKDLPGSTAVVIGASRGFGREIAIALAGAGARVVGAARGEPGLRALTDRLGDAFTAEVADATDPSVAGQIIDAYRPDVLVLNASAPALARPVHLHTWETFSQTWDVDVKQVFHWTREALLAPLDPGAVVISLSSSVALGGSPLSTGFAGAKHTIKFISDAAGTEAQRQQLGIRFVAVLPELAPTTERGAQVAAAYARYAGVDLASSLRRSEPAVTAEQAAKSIVELSANGEYAAPAYLLRADGLAPLGTEAAKA